jgi:hypothetical protein
MSGQPDVVGGAAAGQEQVVLVSERNLFGDEKSPDPGLEQEQVCRDPRPLFSRTRQPQDLEAQTKPGNNLRPVSLLMLVSKS